MKIRQILESEGSPLLFNLDSPSGERIVGTFEIVYEKAGPGGVMAYRCQGQGKVKGSEDRVRVQFDIVTGPRGQWRSENITIKRR
jgi:hypothetical protein